MYAHTDTHRHTQTHTKIGLEIHLSYSSLFCVSSEALQVARKLCGNLSTEDSYEHTQWNQYVAVGGQNEGNCRIVYYQPGMRNACSAGPKTALHCPSLFVCWSVRPHLPHAQ